MAFVIKRQHSKLSGNRSTHTGKKSIINLWGLLIKSLNSKHIIKKPKTQQKCRKRKWNKICLYCSALNCYFTYLPFVCWCFLVYLPVPRHLQGHTHPDGGWHGTTAATLASLLPSIKVRALHQWRSPSLRTPAGRIGRCGTQCTTYLELKLQILCCRQDGPFWL